MELMTEWAGGEHPQELFGHAESTLHISEHFQSLTDPCAFLQLGRWPGGKVETQGLTLFLLSYSPSQVPP